VADHNLSSFPPTRTASPLSKISGTLDARKIATVCRRAILCQVYSSCFNDSVSNSDFNHLFVVQLQHLPQLMIKGYHHQIIRSYHIHESCCFSVESSAVVICELEEPTCVDERSNKQNIICLASCHRQFLHVRYTVCGKKLGKFKQGQEKPVLKFNSQRRRSCLFPKPMLHAAKRTPKALQGLASFRPTRGS
jgi:hypothetical protein